MNKNCIEVWDNCLAVIKDVVTEENFERWFLPLKPVKLENKVLTIQVPSSFYYEWLEEHYIKLLKRVIKRELGNEGKLEYKVIVDSGAKKHNSLNLSTSSSNETVNPAVYMPVNINSRVKKDKDNFPNPFIVPGLRKIQVNSQLVESLSFDNHIEGACNRLARAAGYAVASQPGQTAFNPLFIYSNVGLGKTHLMHAIGLRVKNLFPDKTVLYITAEQFLQQFVESRRNNNTNDFVHFYKMIDVLLVDDVEILSEKLATQDSFSHIFNYLHQNGKQIVISSDKPPKDLIGFEQRLLSRFKWGLSADLQAPDYETKVSIIKKFIAKDGGNEDFPEEVIHYMANNINSNIRELKGAYTSILAQCTFNKKKISLELAKHIIDKYIKVHTKEITIEYIQKVVCDHFGLTVEACNSKTRKREIVQARQLTMYLAKKYTKSSLATIGDICGKKDHATVLYACKAINNLLDTDKNFKAQTERISNKIKSN